MSLPACGTCRLRDGGRPVVPVPRLLLHGGDTSSRMVSSSLMAAPSYRVERFSTSAFVITEHDARAQTLGGAQDVSDCLRFLVLTHLRRQLFRQLNDRCQVVWCFIQLLDLLFVLAPRRGSVQSAQLAQAAECWGAGQSRRLQLLLLGRQCS